MNDIYNQTRVELLTGGFDWTSEAMRLVAWAGTPDFNPVDETVANILTRSGVMIGFSEEITSQTVSSDGTAQTNTVLIPLSVVGPEVTWMTFVKTALTQADSELVLFIDDAIDLPFDPRGLDIVIQPDWLQQRGWWRP